MTLKNIIAKVQNADAVAAASWQMPALSTQLFKLNQSADRRLPDLVQDQLIGLREEKGISLYKVDFISCHQPDSDPLARVDMLVASDVVTKQSRTLTYWTDFEAEILLLKGPASEKCFLGDLLRPKIIVIGGDSSIKSEVASTAAVSPAAHHSWPPARADQSNIVRMEATAGGEWKFWAIWHNGKQVFYHHGRIGEPAGYEGSYVKTSVRAIGGPDAFMQSKIAEKTRKGYVKV